MFKQLMWIFVLSVFATSANAQKDSLVFHNGNYMVGEVKTMDRGVLTVKTNYSDSDFKIEWEGVREIYTVTYFLITLSDGRRYNGYINSFDSEIIALTTSKGEKVEVNQDQIVWLDDVDQGFWSQLYASIDVGFDLTKANDFRQVSTRATLGYLAERWNLDGSYNTLFSRQKETEDVKRTDGGVSFRYFLPKDWYPYASVNFLSNTEQSLKLRTSGSLGMGNYVIHTNRTYWGFNLGANFNNESFTIDTIPDRKSWEGAIGTELNMFDVGDLSLFTKVFAYPGLTEKGRWRTDFNFDAKYEMPFDDDFYLKFGVTVNYDNQPVEAGKETDYIFHTGFGWEW